MRRHSVQSEEGQHCENNHDGSHKPDYVVHGSCPPSVEAFRIAACFRRLPTTTKSNRRTLPPQRRRRRVRHIRRSSQSSREWWLAPSATYRDPLQNRTVMGSLTNATGSQLPGDGKKAHVIAATSPVLAHSQPFRRHPERLHQSRMNQRVAAPLQRRRSDAAHRDEENATHVVERKIAAVRQTNAGSEACRAAAVAHSRSDCACQAGRT